MLSQNKKKIINSRLKENFTTLCKFSLITQVEELKSDNWMNQFRIFTWKILTKNDFFSCSTAILFNYCVLIHNWWCFNSALNFSWLMELLCKLIIYNLSLVLLQWRLFALYRILFPVRILIHCGIGRFCFSFLANFCLILNVLWDDILLYPKNIKKIFFLLIWCLCFVIFEVRFDIS